jgi:hypothetical protein
MRQGQQVPALRRRTDTVDESVRKHLPENLFWQQAQRVFAACLMKEEYDPKFYIEVCPGCGHPLTEEIDSFLSIPGDPRCLLLVGPYGVGKTSLLKHFQRMNVDTDPSNWAWIYFEGNRARARIEQAPQLLINELAATAANYLNGWLRTRKLSREYFLDDVFQNDLSLAEMKTLYEHDLVKKQREIVNDYLKSGSGADLAVMLCFFSRHLAPARTVVVLDNLDPLDPEVQAEAVRQLISFCISAGVKGIVAIRTETEGLLGFRHTGLFGPYVRSGVEAPDLVDVIKKRVEVALEDKSIRDIKIGEGAIQYRLEEVPEFADFLVRGLSVDRTRRVITGLANNSIREGLKMSLSIYAYPGLAAHKLIGRLSPPAQHSVDPFWQHAIPAYVILEALMLRTAQIFDAHTTFCGNLFGTHNSESHLGPFLRLLILRQLRRLPENETGADILEKTLADVLRIDRDLLESELRWLGSERNSWIELTASGRVRLTSRGRFIVDDLLHDRHYLRCISTDVDMPVDAEVKLHDVPKSFKDQLHNMFILLEYLTQCEEEMLRTLAEYGLGPYCHHFGSEGITPRMIERILEGIESAEDKYAGDDDFLRTAHERLETLSDSDVINSIREMLSRFSQAEL